MAEQGQRNFKRQTAIKTHIKSLLQGKYVEQEGWKPNYILTKENKKISRVNLVGVVVSKSKNGSYPSLTLDDGTGKVEVRDFEENKINNAGIGDVVLFIGRPRRFQNSLYLSPEIIRPLKNEGWIRLRKLEGGRPRHKTAERANNKKKESKSKKEVVRSLIRKLDSGGGADYDKVLKKSNLKDGESVIEDLLKDGDVFEVRSGYLKILE